jgi:DnaJ-domain-containing protein 1
MAGENLTRARLFFLVAQFAFWAVLIWMVLRRNFRSSRGSQFKQEALESARKPGAKRARPTRSREVPLLAGIVLNRPAHEILGLSVDASELEIAQAYRDLMKQYHPDKVGAPGTREWQDAQRIAEAINQARDEMMKRARQRTSS